MKNYTAIYSTSTMNGVKYSFDAENLEEAQKFCEKKFDEDSIDFLEIVETSILEKAEKHIKEHDLALHYFFYMVTYSEEIKFYFKVENSDALLCCIYVKAGDLFLDPYILLNHTSKKALGL